MIETISYLGLLDDEEILLDIAALELSALDHEGVSLDPYVAMLSAMEERLAAIGGSAISGPEQAAALAHVVAGEYGFLGDAQSYDAPLNADMIRVMDRRKGLPVSLSILYVALARRLGWIADALNVPGHVMVGIGPQDARILIDPFRGGVSVPPDYLASLLASTLGPDAFPAETYLAPMNNRRTLSRLLHNQASRAEAAGDTARALAVFERMTVVAPDHGQAWWELARLQLAVQQIGAARASLSAMLEVTRDGTVRGQILSTLEAISDR